MKIGSFSPLSFQANVQRQETQPTLKLTSLQTDSVSFTSRNKKKDVEHLKWVNSLYQDALKKQYALGAFNFNNMEGLQAAVAGAKAKNSPLIIQVSAGARKYAGQDYLIAMFKAARKEAATAKVPIMLHLDHGEDYKVCKSCIDAGFDSVMIDASKHSFEKNVEITKKVVDYAHKHGVFVEAELGKIAGTEDDIKVLDKEALFTDPKEAAEFVKRTGCDSLAISVGTKHGPVKFKEGEEPTLDFDRITAIKNAIEEILPENKDKQPTDSDWKQYPLVLHGASSAPQDLIDEVNKYYVIPRTLGEDIKEALINKESNTDNIVNELDKYGEKVKGKGVPESMYTEAAKLGITKVNVDTDFRIKNTAVIKKTLANKPTAIDPRDYNKPARAGLQEIGERKIGMLNSAGKALDLTA